MNKNLQMVYTYHNDTKHSQHRYARSLGYLDWANQPNPYRTYSNTKKTQLPLSFENKTLEYSQIFNQKKEDILSAPLCIEAISQFFQFSLGLAAIKEHGEQSWALRCNASSGNLQPSEAYIVSNDIQGIENGLHHYSPQEHELELLSSADEKLSLPTDSFLVCLSSIVWREAWKYGERSWRYTQLDCGHALKALEISALILGWEIKIINTKDSELQNLIGFNQVSRYVPEERELPDMLIKVSLANKLNNDLINIQDVRASLEEFFEGKANQLSHNWHKWDILEKIEDATLSDDLDIKKYTNDKYETNPYRETSFLAKDIVLKRRSAQIMNKDDCTITKKEFETIIASVKSNNSAIHLVIFVHSVEGIESGLYILVRNSKHRTQLQDLFKENFLWQKVDTEAGELYRLETGDFKAISKAISCSQDIASHGAFTLGMLAEFTNQIEKYGASKYKQLYWDCGAIGQQLYLETTSLQLSATGIGCFLDDILHDIIGLKTNHFQSLYHFTVGRGLIDNRLSTKLPYKNLDN
ncbi:SagB family peptide dehydrogenase [Arcobacter sp. LA11]|uniref:SagB family peptide dehydrogenase n=1 Tax=Arcobacter sp. LA11 TaxID=1898176 RepID=UPI0009323C6B|nr:SagB family peptide dehydrogenase [Arcobacter sp. LA11]